MREKIKSKRKRQRRKREKRNREVKERKGKVRKQRKGERKIEGQVNLQGVKMIRKSLKYR